MNEYKDEVGKSEAQVQEMTADDQGTNPRKMCAMCGENVQAFNENELCADCNNEMWNKIRD